MKKTLVVILFLSACGGTTPGRSGPMDPGIASTVLADTVGVRANLAGSNANWKPFGSAGQLKRWTGVIPVDLQGSVMAAEALNLIENKLGMVIFDRNAVGIGLIINEGGADEWCGNVSNSPGEKGLELSIAGSGNISGTYYINVGNADCAPTPEIYAHEFGHALGLGGHFAGFYDDLATKTPSVDGNFWNTLYTLYHNPAGTEIAAAVIFLPETNL